MSADEGRRWRSGRGLLWIGRGGRWRPQQLSCHSQVILAPGVGEQPVVADPVQSSGQHVQEEAADELAGGQRHRLVPSPALVSVILPVEAYAAFIEGDQPAVGDGHPVRVAGQIRQYRFGTGERPLGADRRLDLAQRSQPFGNGGRIDQLGVLTEEEQLPVAVGAQQRFEKQPPGTIPCTCGWWVSARLTARTLALSPQFVTRMPKASAGSSPP